MRYFFFFFVNINPISKEQIVRSSNKFKTLIRDNTDI